MRITNQGLLNNILVGLQRNGTRLEDYQTRISSGKRVLDPSDDPAATVKILDLRSQMVQAKQYADNAQNGQELLDQSDNIISQIETALHRVREIAVSAANGTNNAGSYEADAKELDQIIRGLVDLGNTSVENSYIFSGQALTTAPFVVQETDGAVTKVDRAFTLAPGATAIQREIAPGVAVDVNVTADDLFGVQDEAAGKSDLLNKLVALREHITTLSNNVTDGTAQAGVASGLNELTAAEDSLLSVHTDVGARVKRLEAAITRVDALSDGLTKLISKQEDLDVPKAILELATVDASYKLSLQMGARIVQPTLLDFLR